MNEEASTGARDIPGLEQAEEAFRKSEEEAKRLAKELELLAKIGRIISSTLKIEEVYGLFAEEVGKLIPLDRISIGLFDLETGTIETTYVCGIEVADRKAGNPYPLAGSLGEQIMRTRKSLLVQSEDPSEVVKYSPRLLTTFQAGLRSMLSVPLIAKDQVIGILHIRSCRKNAYKQNDVNLAERVGNQIAGAMVNARLYSELREAKETLQKKEKEFRELYAHAPLGYHEYNGEGKITRVNQTDLEMLGYRAEEMIGQPIWKFNVGEELAKGQVMAKLAGRFPPGKNLERIYRRKDGSTFPVLIEDRLIKDEKGEILGIRCTIQDITERKRAEEALGKSEEEAKRLAQENAIMAEIGRIISSTPIIEEVYERFGEELGKLISFDRIAVNIIDPRNYTLLIAYVLGSPAPQRELRDVFPLGGTAAEEILKTRSSLFLQGRIREEVAERYPGLHPILNAGYRSIIMAPLISKNEVFGVFNVQSKRDEAYCELDLKLIERVSIQISGAIANAQFFAERRKMLEQFMRSEERYRNLVERSPDMILLHQKGKLVYVNPAAVRILGASKPDDLIGQSILERIHPDYWGIARERIAQVGGNAEVPLLEGKFIRLDGTSVDVEVMASTIFYQEELMVQVVARDITERKHAAEKMATLQTQLFQSQKMEAIGRLAGGFAHDFNNSLTLIKTCTQLTLLELRENDPFRDLVCAGFGAGEGGPRPNRTGCPESSHQRQGCDAQGW
jgi:PAS domain S-box-containing protein